MGTTLVIGVDGGGSKTHVIVADAEGNERASAEGGRSAVWPGQADRSAEAIAQAVETALSGEELDDARVAVLVAGLAGVGRDEECRALERSLGDLGIADEIIVETDAAIALADAFGEGSGVLLIAGTGSIAYGRSPTGDTARCGGWGPNVGDEGSGTWIGRRALSIVAAAADGREPPTALTGAILTAAQVNTAEELIPWAAAADNTALAALAPVVFTTAQTDARANTLVDLAAEELVLHVRALARKLFGEERASFAVALSGGLLQRGSLLRRKVEQRLKSAVPGAQLRAEPVIAARGAVRIAVKRLRSMLPTATA
jgi:glucosamine kinase